MGMWVLLVDEMFKRVSFRTVATFKLAHTASTTKHTSFKFSYASNWIEMNIRQPPS